MGKPLFCPVIDMLEIPKQASEFEGLIQQWSDGFRKIQLLRAAIELNLFETLKNPKTAGEVATEFNGNHKLVKLMLECLVNTGLLVKRGDKYALSEISRTFLCADSQYSQINFLKKHFSDLEMWQNLEKIVKEGPVRVDRAKFFSESVIHSMAQHSLLGELQKTVEVISKYEEFRRARRLIDLGGGHGLYSVAFTKLNPKLKAVVFDLPEVVKRGREYAEKYGAERVEFVAGDFFKDDIGSGYDIVFSSYNPSGKNIGMIYKIKNALKTGGIYVNKQYFWNNSKEIDLCDLEWNLWCFGEIEKSEKKYTFKKDLSLEEYIEELVKRDFEILDVVNLGEAKMIVARKKK
ncbi:methyltransferase [Archaeoglobus sp. UBA230]|jgi:predicted transcriptional regulator|uniref:methyltransferase n=2 Tax=Archaeoglobus TaxID=2233 RepID=UPI0025BDE693|nr:methyltransferase [Archaeoglobus sp. UBA230]